MVNTPMEYRYRKTVTAIGWSLILFLIFLTLFELLLLILGNFLNDSVVSEVNADLIYQITYGAIYLFSFMFPVVILKSHIKKSGFSYTPMQSNFRLSPWLFPVFFAGITLIWAQSTVNSFMVSVFQYSTFSNQFLWQSSNSMEGYQIVLQFIVMCVIPAVCEEFLFRGAILSNLLPFGKGTAILISSLLFGIMHQNAEQILYAFAAGCLLGFLYEKTGNILNCVFLHLLNNFLSLAGEIFSFDMGGVSQELLLCIFSGVLFLLGSICIPILLVKLSKKKDLLADGFFEKSIPQDENYVPCKVESKRQFRLFFCLPMILFFVLCILKIILLLLLAVFYVTF